MDLFDDKKNSEQDIDQILLYFANHPHEFVQRGFLWNKKGSILEGKKLNNWQIQLLKDLQKENPDIPGIKRMAIAAGNGVGKTTIIAFIVVWFLLTHQNVRIIVTAARESQLRTTVWANIETILSLCKYGRHVKKAALKLWIATEDNQRIVIGSPWSIERPESFAGQHADHNLVIFDEASAIPKVIWDTARGAVATGNSYFLAFGNPTRNSGVFYDCFNTMSKLWDTRNISCLDCDHVTQDFIDQVKEEYGEGSDQYRVYVLGLPPINHISGLLDANLIQEAFEREQTAPTLKDKDPIFMGVDIAGGRGGDYSVIIIRKGYNILHTFRSNNMIIDEFVDQVKQLYYRYEVDAIGIDSVAVGLQAYQHLKEKHFKVFESSPNKKPIRAFRNCANIKAELFCEIKKWFESRAPMLHDFKYKKELMEELVNIEFGFQDDRLLKIMPKTEFRKKKSGGSHDIADALSYTFLPELYGVQSSSNDEFSDNIKVKCRFRGKI